MRRVDLVECVDLVSPALANHEIIPILNHIWFTGSNMMAYNDAIAISSRLKTEFECAIQGNTFTSLIKTLRAEEVSLTQDQDNLRLKAGGVNISFPSMPASSFIFEMPKPANDVTRLPETFFDGLELCLQSAGNDPSKPEQLGVTLVQTDKFLAMFGTNDLTLTYVPISLPNAIPIKNRVTLSTEFCKQAVKIAKTKKNRIEINDDYSLLVAEGGATLFGKLIESDRPIEFHKIVNSNAPSDLKKIAIPIPDRLKEMVERAIIIGDAASEKNHTTITVNDDRLKFETKSQLRGEITDSMRLKENHPEVTLKIDCRHIKAGIDTYDKMLLTNKCMILTNLRGAIYMVAAMA